MDKYTDSGDSNLAQNKLSENSVIVYLSRNGYFFLDIDVPSNDLKSLRVNISAIEVEENNIDYYDSLADTSFDILFEYQNT